MTPPVSGAPVVAPVMVDPLWRMALLCDDDSLRPFVRSKWELLDGPQRGAVAGFLEAMTPHRADAAARLGDRDRVAREVARRAAAISPMPPAPTVVGHRGAVSTAVPENRTCGSPITR